MKNPNLTSKQQLAAQKVLASIGTALRNTTVVSAKWFVYVCVAATLIQIVGPEIISSVAIPASVFMLIQRLLESSVLQKLLNLIGGNLLAGVIDRVATHESTSQEDILRLIEQSVDPDKIESIFKETLEQAGLLTESDFYKTISRLSRHEQQQHNELAQTLSQILERLNEIAPPNRVQMDIDVEVGNYLTSILNDTRYKRWSSEALSDYYASLEITNLSEQFPLLVLDYDPSDGISSRPSDAIQTIRDSSRLVIVGEPGAGKTTIFEKAMYEIAYQQSLILDSPVLVPVLVSLRYYRGDGNLLSLITLGLSRQNILMWNNDDLHELLSLNRLKMLVLFDGLNEVPNKYRSDIVTLIQQFQDEFPSNQYVINCRTSDYHFDFGNVPTVITQPLSNSQIIEYFSHHLGSTDGRLFFTNLPDAVKFICRTPLILSMITSAAKHGIMPKNRGQLYTEFVRSILWLEGGKGEKASRIKSQTKIAILEYIAYTMQDQGILYLSTQTAYSMLRPLFSVWGIKLDSIEIIDELKINGLLVEDNFGISFIHQSFQEYFSAAKIEHGYLGGFGYEIKYINNSWWHETILMLGGFTSQPDDLLNAVLAEDPYLAARCLIQGCKPSQTTLQKVIHAIGQLTMSNVWTDCRHAADIFVELKMPEAIPYLIPLLSHYERTVRWAALYALRNIRSPHVIDKLIDVLEDTDWAIRGEACVTIAELVGIQGIKHIIPVLDDKHAYARGRAAYGVYLSISQDKTFNLEKELSNQPQEISQVCKWIMLLVNVVDLSEELVSGLMSHNSRIVEAALNILVEEHKKLDLVKTIDALSNLLSHENPMIRAGATQAFGRLQIYEKIPEITNMMCTDPESIVREVACVTLKMLNAKESVPNMLDRLGKDKSAGVKRRILLNLIEMHISDANSDVAAILDDSDAEVRGIGCRYIGEFGDYSYKSKLTHLTCDGEPMVSEAAHAALRNITKRDQLSPFSRIPREQQYVHRK